MFYAKTVHSNILKAMFEILFQNMTSVCLIIDRDGIRSENVSSQGLDIRIFLPADKFDTYVYDYEEPQQFVGIGSHVNQFLRSVKNKTSIVLSMTNEYVLDIDICSSNEDYVVTLSANIENIQNLASSLLDNYTSNPVSISNVTFNQICKAFKSPTLNVTKKNGQISFSFEITGISRKILTFGKKDMTDTSLIFRSYKTDNFTRVNKLSSFSTKNISIFIEDGKMLLIEAVSDLGSIKVHVPHADDR